MASVKYKCLYEYKIIWGLMGNNIMDVLRSLKGDELRWL